ncbi:MAG TPA: DNA damage-inducible protein D [Ktedonobacteraceae bacterium]|nr:DNA damage-inducible protein D [Ktedonobacteraceae bacterium]
MSNGPEQPNQQHTSPFDAIQQTTPDSQEYWSARDLGKLLGYTEYRKFKNAIQKAETACEQSGQQVADHFAHVGDMVSIGSGARRKVDDIHLSRYACYLIVENADPSKPIVALGQAYFAVQTRRQELADELAMLPEEQKRLIYRSQMTIFNTRLAEAAQRAGVIEPFDFAIFQDHGYRGLYAGETAALIAARKGLEPGQHILDYMGSEELGANIFRATQTEAKLRREGITDKEQANRTHYQVGRKVRQTIDELGGTMPENLPRQQRVYRSLNARNKSV